MATANDYKDRLEKIIVESISANTSQIMQGTSNMEDYKYMLGIQHTLVDLNKLSAWDLTVTKTIPKHRLNGLKLETGY